jgi:hypothetical protein
MNQTPNNFHFVKKKLKELHPINNSKSPASKRQKKKKKNREKLCQPVEVKLAHQSTKSSRTVTFENKLIMGETRKPIS